MKLVKLLITFVALFGNTFCVDEEFETATQSSTATFSDDRDITRSPIRLTFYENQNESSQQAQKGLPLHPLAYSNEWKPMLMPIPLSSFRVKTSDPNSENERPGFQPTPLQRTSSQIKNLTESMDQYPVPSDDIRVPLSTAFLPFPPLFFPRPMPSDQLSGMSDITAQNTQEIKNESSSFPWPFFYGPNAARPDIASDNFPFIPRSFPIPAFFLPNVLRNKDQENSLIKSEFPRAPFIYPPPLSVGDDRNYLVSQGVNPFVGSPFMTIVPASSEGKSILPKDNIREEGSISLPEDELSSEDPISSEPIASESVPPEMPIRPLPVFPLGVLPPSYMPPFAFPPQVFSPPVLPEVPPAIQTFPDTPLPAGELSKPNAFPLEILPEETLPPRVLPANVEQAENVPLEIVSQDKNVEEDIINSARIPYEFGYEMNDGNGTDQHRQEIADETGAVKGSYGYKDPLGVYRLVNYFADQNGFRAFIQTNEPGVANPGSADVVVMAEVPPPRALAEGFKQPELIPVEIPDSDLIAEGSVTK
ncbi:fibrous sheath CABYR-binding protein-like [Stegodyphus dumicola]|uniref:fibrous sheath CABYR-binding protein-like n=1 Tax=Stegodyphus dumicola TaxID=202533 RepID=UPI0015AA1262|nr:fibrous sheath CABYR-binding protein-like [Stegodyphus dumicola]